MGWVGKIQPTLRDFTDGYENYFGFLGEFTSDHSKMERGLNHPSNNLLPTAAMVPSIEAKIVNCWVT